MEQVGSLLRQMEAYKNITADQLSYSKVIKVLKKIVVQLSLLRSYEQFALSTSDGVLDTCLSTHRRS